MQDRKLDNQTLDALGKKLIVSEARRVVDVDAIVSNPRLFAAVRARIAAIETPEPRASWFAFTRFNIVASSAAAAVLLLVVGAFSLLDTGRGVVAVNTIQVPPTQVAEIARPVFPPQGKSLGKLSTGRANKDEVRPQRAVMSPPKRTRQPEVRFEAQGDFYAVGYTGDPSEAAVSDARIIRVDLDRSSLFALGVNLPLDNYAETVRADLLVGSDGVTRGVRVVK